MSYTSIRRLLLLIHPDKHHGGESEALFPFNQKRVGAPTNKVRSFVYALCDSCLHLPDRQQRVEDKIFAEEQVQ